MEGADHVSFDIFFRTFPTSRSIHLFVRTLLSNISFRTRPCVCCNLRAYTFRRYGIDLSVVTLLIHILRKEGLSFTQDISHLSSISKEYKKSNWEQLNTLCLYCICSPSHTRLAGTSEYDISTGASCRTSSLLSRMVYCPFGRLRSSGLLSTVQSKQNNDTSSLNRLLFYLPRFRWRRKQKFNFDGSLINKPQPVQYRNVEQPRMYKIHIHRCTPR